MIVLTFNTIINIVESILLPLVGFLALYKQYGRIKTKPVDKKQYDQALELIFEEWSRKEASIFKK